MVKLPLFMDAFKFLFICNSLVNWMTISTAIGGLSLRDSMGSMNRLIGGVWWTLSSANTDSITYVEHQYKLPKYVSRNLLREDEDAFGLPD